jgi:phage head maturation protease
VTAPTTIPVLEYKTLGATLAAPTTLSPDNTGDAVVVGYDDAKGTVDAVVAVTGTRDEVADLITPGAFEVSIKARHPKMCLGHDWNRPIGWPIDYKELRPGDPRLPTETADGKPWPAEAGGLWTRNQYMLDTQDGRDAYAHAKFYGNKTAYSIGYVVTKSRKALIDGLPTRIIDALDLYEYGPVLHGAHPLATQQGVKSGHRQDLESKVRLVHDAHYWGLPLGTPIHPGMKPRGPKAQKLERAGHAVSDTEGAVDLGTDKLRLKPTAKGKAKFRPDGALESQLFGEIMTGLGSGQDPAEFSVDDPNGLNKAGNGEYNPLDLMVANGVTPADLEDVLRNADWDQTRLGDSANQQDDIDQFVSDTVDAYREKYNAALVQQHGSSETSNVPDDPAADAAVGVDGPTPAVPDTASEAPDAGAPETPAAPASEATAPQASTEPATPAAPATPSVSTTKLTTLPKHDAAAAVSSMSDDELAGHDTEMATRATQLGKPGQVSPNHQTVKDEVARRAANPKPQAPAAPAPAAAKPPRKLAAKPAAAIGAAKPGSVTQHPTGPDGKPDTTAEPVAKQGLVTDKVPPKMADGLAKAGLAEHTAEPGKMVLTPQGEQHHHAINGTTPPAPNGAPGEQAPTAPTMSTDKLASLHNQDATAAVGAMSDHELAGHDQELTSRASQLGQPDQVTPNHQAVKDEIAQRPAPVPGGVPPTAAVGVPGAAQTTPGAPAVPGEPANANAVAAETLRTLPRDASGRVDLLNAPTSLVQTMRQAGVDDGDGAERDEQSFTHALDALDQQYGQDPAMAHALATARGFVTGDAPNARVIQKQAAVDAKQFQTDNETPVGDRADAVRVLASALSKSGMAYMSDPSGNIRDSRPIPNALSKYAQALISYHGVLPPAKVDKPSGAPDYTPTGDASRVGELTDSQLAAEVGHAQGKLDEITQADPRRESGQHADAKLKLDAFQGEHGRRQQAGETHPDETAPDASGGTPPNPEAVSTTSTQDGQPAAIPNAANETGIPGAPAAPPATSHSDAVPTPQEAAQITADEQGEVQDIGDSSQGVVESDDGEIEVEPDVAERQDRIATLLGQSDGGNLDLGSQEDDQLRSTRGDIVSEIQLQQYLDNRNRQRAAPQPATPEPPHAPEGAAPAEGTADDRTPGTRGIPGAPPPSVPAESGPPPQRPGVAGAAEDFADALESGDSEQVDAARARLASSLRRSKTDVASVGAMRELASGEGDPSADDLRASAQAVRVEVRERRNTSARSRRTARRFERDRLRNLLHQVEGEMDRRNMRYDPVPEDTADGAPAPSTWKTELRKHSWSNLGYQEDRLNGTNFTATVSVPVNGKNNPTGGAGYTWTTTDNDGNTITQGNGTVDNATGARDAIVVALRAQQALGNLPADAGVPEPSAPLTSSARTHADVSAAINQMQDRLGAVERSVNPITGARDPLGKHPTLTPPTRPAFTSADQVRQHLATLDGGGSESQQFIADRAKDIQWDNVQLTPGGGLMVVTVAGEKDPQLWHTGSGRSAMSLIYRGSGGATRMSAPDLLRAGTLMESLPDDNGHTVDFSGTDNNSVVTSTSDYTVNDRNGVGAFARNVMSALAAEKIKGGQWGSPVVRGMSSDVAPFTPGSNHTRAGYVQQNHDALTTMLSNSLTGRRVKPSGEDANTLNAAAAAQTLTNLGAPDAAAVLLRRRAAEVRATFGGDADAHGASTLDNLAAGHLSTYSPVLSPGERLLSITQGERVTVADPDGNARSYRVLSPPRTGAFPAYRTASVMDESTGETGVLNIANNAADQPQMTISPGPDLPAMVRIDLHSPTFTVTGADEPVPADADEVRANAMAEVDAIPREVLDAAAAALPSTSAETAARRALPADQRPPRRTSPRAVPRAAPEAKPGTPVAGEQHLAATQAGTLSSWVGAEHALSDSATSGGFESLDAWREWAKDAASDPNTPEMAQRGLTNALLLDTYLPENGARLSPGGHMIVHKNGNVIYARAGLTVFPAGAGTMSAIGVDKIPPDTGMAIADGIERSSWNGQTVRWGEGYTAAIADLRQVQENLPRASDKVGYRNPMLSPAKLAFAGQVAEAKTPRVGDVDALEALASGSASPNMPNPDAIGGLHLRDREDVYRQMAGVRTRTYSDKAGAQPADTKAGQNLAKRVATEMRIAQSLSQVAPLDASRRLNRVADEVDGQKITESRGGPEHDPAAEMRAAARAIADAYDETKVTPFGKLRRAGNVGLVVPRSAPQVVAKDGSLNRDDRAKALGEMLAQGVQFTRGEDGAAIARFGDQAVTTSTTPGQFTTAYAGGNGKPTQGAIGVQPDGSITMRWQDRFTRTTVRVTIPAGGWDFQDLTTEE